VFFVVLLLFCAMSRAAENANSSPSSDMSNEASLPVLSRPLGYVAIAATPPSKERHAFFDRTNVELFAGIAITRTLDFTSTLNMQARGREEILLPDDVVNNRAGFAALEAAGAATSIGLSYLLHATGHHKLERWLSIGHISVTGFGAARNYALTSHHP
jgi:hypothetical protein